jgi:A/G-specific adenine glycosylase
MVIAYASIFIIMPTLTFLVGRFLDRVFALPPFPPLPLNLPAGFAVFLFGLAIGIKSTRLLYFEGRGLPWGEVQRETQSTTLVTTGLYASTRNPMTFGYSLLPCGMGILFRSLAMTCIIPATIFIAMIIWLKLREEPRLERRFGQEYRDYKRRTPFLIPHFVPLVRDLATPIAGSLRRRGTQAPQDSADSEDLSEHKIRPFQRRLLRWYRRHGRDLPWRRTRDPYCILVSEIMLHQTQVDRVIPKYHEWLTVYPTFEALAAAPLEEVKERWRPLGYNFRPERLQRIAQHVVNQLNGELPNTLNQLRALPGVGRYTAGAILSFAFHQDAPIVDTNVRRLILRIFGVQSSSNRAAVERRVWQLAEILIPHGKAFIFNQALIDFGALMCTARNPACPTCFASDLCMKRQTETLD